MWDKMIKDRKDCAYWVTWYCMKKRISVLTDEGKVACKNCKEFISKEDKERKKPARGKK